MGRAWDINAKLTVVTVGDGLFEAHTPSGEVVLRSSQMAHPGPGDDLFDRMVDTFNACAGVGPRTLAELPTILAKHRGRQVQSRIRYLDRKARQAAASGTTDD